MAYALAITMALLSFTANSKGALAGPKTMTLAWETAPRTIDPRFTIDAKSHYLSDLQNCSLINFDENGQIIGSLAKSWAWLDNKNLEVIIKDNITFSNGDKVTAQDVKATYQFFHKTNLKKPSPLAPAFKKITKIATKANKLTFTFAEPDVGFLQNLMIGIVPKKYASQEMFTKPGSYPGCGPFTLTQLSSAQLTLEKNKKYNLSSPAKIDRVVIKIVKDELTRYAKIQKGEVDIIENGVNREKLAGIEKQVQLTVVKKSALDTTYLGFNMKDPILRKAQVRRAIAHAINRDEIIKYILKNTATKATTILTEGSPFYNKNLKQIKYDPALAKKLLAQAGYKNKIRFELNYKTTTNTTRVSIAKAIASQLAKVGIKVKVQPLEWGKFKSDVEKGHVQMWSLSWVGFKDPDIYRYAFSSESFPPNGGNRGWYKNTTLDKVLQEAKIASDTKKRIALYYQAEDIIAAELPYVFLWHEQNFAVIRKGIKGFRLYADGRLSSLKDVTK